MLPQELQSPLRVNPVLPNDFRAIQKLYTCSVRCNPKGFIQDMRYHAPIHSVFSDYCNSGGDMLVAKVGKKVVGMGGLRSISKERAELCKLHVSRDYQGMGYGKYLARRLLSRARELNFKEIELHVTKTQTVAIHLYKKLGFSIIKEIIFTAESAGRKSIFDTIYMEISLVPNNG